MTQIRALTSSIHEEPEGPATTIAAESRSAPQAIRFDEWQKLAYRIANGYARKFDWIPREDFEQEALIALFESIGRYDASRGAKFITYAHAFINGRLMDFAKREMRHTIPEGSRAVDPDEFIDTDFDTSAECAQGQMSNAVYASLQYLTDQERRVIYLLFWKDMSGTDTAANLGLSNGRITQLSKSAQTKLKPILACIH